MTINILVEKCQLNHLGNIICTLLSLLSSFFFDFSFCFWGLDKGNISSKVKEMKKQKETIFLFGRYIERNLALLFNRKRASV